MTTHTIEVITKKRLCFRERADVDVHAPSVGRGAALHVDGSSPHQAHHHRVACRDPAPWDTSAPPGRACSARRVAWTSWREDGPGGDASCHCCGTMSACDTGVHRSSCASQAPTLWFSRSWRSCRRRWRRWPRRLQSRSRRVLGASVNGGREEQDLLDNRKIFMIQ